MKKFKTLMMMAAMATASLFSFTSCDDDPWDRPYWDDPYGWYGDYDDWGWNNNQWNHGQQGSQDNTLTAMAQMLCGEWGGTLTYSYINEDGQSRSTDQYYTTMKFFQYNQNSRSLSGEGVETDYLTDNQGNPIESQSQTLDFYWYIQDNGDIYIKYKKSGATFVLDYGSSQRGFYMGEEQGHRNDVFYGYMIGTGNVNGDIIYIDFERMNQTGWAKKSSTRAASDNQVVSFGHSAYQVPVKATGSQFNNRR